ncbi:MAG: hypothetical protein WC247_12705 [Porticoccaceae bacterium]|jgi:hypothetical protein
MASYVRPVPTTDNPSASGKRVVFRLLPAAVVLGAAALLTACGGGEPSGEYIGIEGAVVDKLEFGPDDKVRTTEAGETKEGTFRFEGDKLIVVTIDGDQNALTITDDGCLNGGYLGTYCKP